MVRLIGSLGLTTVLLPACVVRNADLGEDGTGESAASADAGDDADDDGGREDDGIADEGPGDDGIPPDDTGPEPTDTGDPDPPPPTGETGGEPPMTTCDDVDLEPPVTSALRAHVQSLGDINRLELGSHPFMCGTYPEACERTWYVSMRLPPWINAPGEYDLGEVEMTFSESENSGPPQCELEGGSGGGGPGFPGLLIIMVWNDDCIAGYVELYEFPTEANGAFRAVRCP